VKNEMSVTFCVELVLLRESTELSFLRGETKQFKEVSFFPADVVPPFAQGNIALEPLFNEVEKGVVIHVAAKVVAETAGSGKIFYLGDTAVAFGSNVFSGSSILRSVRMVMFFNINHPVTAVATSMVLWF
jgi:hypothetical protein